jgi:hypothetical protein
VADEDTVVGVPLMAPVEVENERPVGKEGETDQEVAVPAVEIGVMVVMATPLVKVDELGL